MSLFRFHWKSNARGENDPDRVHPAGSGRDQESGVARPPPDGDDRGDGHHHDLDARDLLPRHRFDLRRARQGAAVARRLTSKKTSDKGHEHVALVHHPRLDRKSVVKGKRVSVRVDLGGRRSIKTKKKKRRKKKKMKK